MEELDLKQIFMIIWNKKIHIILIMIVFVIIGAIYSFNFVEPRYKAYTTLILAKVNQADEEIVDNKQITSTDITLNSKLISTYSELVKSSSLLQTVKSNLDLDISEQELKKSITVTNKEDTELIEIDVTNENAATAAAIANEIAKEFSKQVEKIYKINNIYIIDEAKITTIPYNINHVRDILIFAAVGMVISAAYVILYTLFDTTIKSSEDIERDIGLTNLISIPEVKQDSKSIFALKELVTLNDVKSIISESFRTLRTNIQFTNKKGKKTILITSCFSGEGKSYIAANLAVTFAQAGKRVILVDADMRKGRQGKLFNLDARRGLSNYLSNLDEEGNESVDNISKYVRETDVTNLNVICSGNVPPNPSELLTSEKIQNLIYDLEEVYDLIIFDGAPILPVADSLILSRLAGSTVLVSSYKKTKKDDLNTVRKAVDNVGGRIIGTIINRVPMTVSNYSGQYYYYGEKNKGRRIKEKEKKNIFKEFFTSIGNGIKKFKTRNRRLNEKNEIIELEPSTQYTPKARRNNKHVKDVQAEDDNSAVNQIIKPQEKQSYVEGNEVKKSQPSETKSSIEQLKENEAKRQLKKPRITMESDLLTEEQKNRIMDELRRQIIEETRSKNSKVPKMVLDDEDDDVAYSQDQIDPYMDLANQTKHIDDMSDEYIIEHIYPKTKHNKEI